MESLYVLLPVSVVLVLAILGVLAWAIFRGQFDSLEQEGLRILQEEDKQTKNLDQEQG